MPQTNQVLELFGFCDIFHRNISQKLSVLFLQEYDAQTQFFVMHDYDNNTKLDGLELLKSMTHFHEEHEDEDQNKKDCKTFLSDFAISQTNVWAFIFYFRDLSNGKYLNLRFMNERRIQKTSFMVFVFQAWILNVFKGFGMYLKYPETAFGFTQFSHSAFT